MRQRRLIRVKLRKDVRAAVLHAMPEILIAFPKERLGGWSDREVVMPAIGVGSICFNEAG